MDSTRGSASHNLFFALWPDEALRSRIETAALALQAAHRARGRRTRPQRYHMTLGYLGAHAELPGDLIVAARAVGDRLGADAFDCRLDIAGSFAGRSIPWWLGCSEIPTAMAQLVDGIAQGMQSRGYAGKQEAKFAAHVTVLRDADRRLATTAIAPIDWNVAAFVLVDSELGPRPSYTIVERWPLTARVLPY